jgi:uncharacterized protein (TIGR04551 family)
MAIVAALFAGRRASPAAACVGALEDTAMKHLLLFCLAAAWICWAGPATAQGMGPRPSPGMTQPEKEAETKEGPAEEMPEEEVAEVDIPVVPDWPGRDAKKLTLFEMKGYFRFRWYMHHNLGLGMDGPAAPFYNPLSESSELSCAGRSRSEVPGGGERDLDEDCKDKTLGGADIRLRLEPTINVREGIRINTQLDVFDNLVLGSTPASLGEGGGTPLDFFADSQAPPVAGQNSRRPAIVVKRAWAEVDTPLGLLRFGRMPSGLIRYGRQDANWGLGLMANAGGCWNCNFGDNVDRVMFTALPNGYTLAMGYDFAASGPNSLSVNPGVAYYGGQGIDLEKLDDVHQLFWVVGRIDPDEVVEDRADRGELVLNYGLYLLWRKQDFDYASTVGYGATAEEYAEGFLERHAWSLTPDLWVKLIWGYLRVEFEGVFRGGQIANTSDENIEQELDILQFGWALRSSYAFLRDTLRVGLELGMASGDQAESPTAEVNRRRANPLLYDTDGTFGEFRFHQDYQVDLILFREVLTTVANAMYFKPSIQYEPVDTFGARLDVIYSLTHEPVGFPGNSRNLGLEMDLDVYYVNIEDGFYAGLRYGVLVPLGALDRPTEIYEYTTVTPFDAEVAHTLQGRLLVRF